MDGGYFELRTGMISRSQVKNINGLIYSQAHQYAISGIKPLLLAMKKRND